MGHLFVLCVLRWGWGECSILLRHKRRSLVVSDWHPERELRVLCWRSQQRLWADGGTTSNVEHWALKGYCVQPPIVKKKERKKEWKRKNKVRKNQLSASFVCGCTAEELPSARKLNKKRQIERFSERHDFFQHPPKFKFRMRQYYCPSSPKCIYQSSDVTTIGALPVEVVCLKRARARAVAEVRKASPLKSCLKSGPARLHCLVFKEASGCELDHRCSKYFGSFWEWPVCVRSPSSSLLPPSFCVSS